MAPLVSLGTMNFLVEALTHAGAPWPEDKENPDHSNGNQHEVSFLHQFLHVGEGRRRRCLLVSDVIVSMHVCRGSVLVDEHPVAIGKAELLWILRYLFDRLCCIVVHGLILSGRVMETTLSPVWLHCLYAEDSA